MPRCGREDSRVRGGAAHPLRARPLLRYCGMGSGDCGVLGEIGDPRGLGDLEV